MMVTLPSLALALLSLLQAGAEVPVQSSFRAEKFAGTWHIAAAASNCSVFLKIKDGMKSATITISLTPEDDLDMKLVWPMMDKCQKFELLFQRSGQTGHYVAQEKKDMHVMETDYSHYAIVHQLQQNGQDRPRTALQLLTREQDVTPQLLQRFKELIPTVGLTKDMLAVLPKSDHCTEVIS